MKKRLFIFTVLLTAAFTVNAVTGETLSELQQQSQGIKSKIKNAKEELTSVQNQKDDAVSEIQQLDSELADVQAQLDMLTKQLEETSQRLDITTEELEQATEEREQQYETLKQRVRSMYENGTAGYLETILNAENMSDFLQRMEYTSRIMDYDQHLLENFSRVETLIDQSKTRIEQDKANQERLKRETEDEQELLNDKIAEKNALVEKLNSSAESYEAQISEWEEQDADIQALIKKKQAAAASSSRTTSRSSYSGGSSYQASNKVYAYTGDKYMYPVPAYSGYTPNSGYGYMSSSATGKSHTVSPYTVASRSITSTISSMLRSPSASAAGTSSITANSAQISLFILPPSAGPRSGPSGAGSATSPAEYPLHGFPLPSASRHSGNATVHTCIL